MTETDTLDCPHGTRCGGCAFLGVPYPEQLEQKWRLLQRGVLRYPEHAALRLAKVEGAEPIRAYRIRAKLVFGADGVLGLFERDSHDVVDIPECRVLAPPLARVAAAARRVFSRARPELDALDLRQVDDGVLVTLIAAEGTPLEDLKRLSLALCSECSEVRSVAASFRALGAATVLGTGHVLLAGNEVERHHLQSSGPYHLAAHGAFTQVHPGQANAAHTAIERALTECGARRVLELYAGSGALSLRLAGAKFAMTAVEAFAPALAQAERAAREQNLKLTTVTGSAERALAELRARGARFDALIVNPPRRGLSVEVRRAAAALDVATILYMSCNPETLARDLAELRDLGYLAQELRPFDMIPHSQAVECLVALRRGPIPAPRVLHESVHLLGVFKSGFEPVSREAGVPGALLDRVRRLPGAHEALPLPAQRLDQDTSGVCLFARTASALPALERAFYAGTHSFVGLCRGVSHKRGRIRRPVREGRRVVQASTRYLRDGLRSGHSLLTIWPERACPWHLRQLLAGVGHPLLGDAHFGDAASNAFFEHRHGLDRSFLHCSAVTLALESGPLTIEVALPGELLAVLASLSEQSAPPS
jgi:23S rRNA (uracil1939-C5)-methyltransferase